MRRTHCCATGSWPPVAAGGRLKVGTKQLSLGRGGGEEVEGGEGWVPLTRVSPQQRHGPTARHRHIATTAGWHIPASTLRWQRKQTKTENQREDKYTQGQPQKCNCCKDREIKPKTPNYDSTLKNTLQFTQYTRVEQTKYLGKVKPKVDPSLLTVIWK